MPIRMKREQLDARNNNLICSVKFWFDSRYKVLLVAYKNGKIMSKTLFVMFSGIFGVEAAYANCNFPRSHSSVKSSMSRIS